jgi:hypothetical protein
MPARIDIYGVELGGLTDDTLSQIAETSAKELASLLVERTT